MRRAVLLVGIALAVGAAGWWMSGSFTSSSEEPRTANLATQSMPATIGKQITPPSEQAPNGLDGVCDDVMEGVATVNAGTLPPNVPAAVVSQEFSGSKFPEMPISEEEAEALRQEALLMPPSFGFQDMDDPDTKPFAPTPGVAFDSINSDECCSGGTSVPPDPELAVGPNHIIAVVNTSFEVYNKSGTSLVGPTDFDVMFANLDTLLGAGAQCTGLFDPNVNYDEGADRYFIGVDDSNAYCMAVSQTGDPTGLWNLYRVPTLVVPGTTLFDYPHAGIGEEAIFMGSNQFGGGFIEGRVWAFEKAAMYAGDAATDVGCRSRTIPNGDSTPWPADIKGPPLTTEGIAPHYIISEVFNGADHTVWAWDDPFGVNQFTNLGSVDLNAATGVVAGFPVDVPQQGGGFVQANDWRTQSTFYRNGYLWMTNQTISCNPGAGTVDCIRWAQIDPGAGNGPVAPSVMQAGVIASNGMYRFFGSLGVDACNNMAIGYSVSSPSMFIGTYVTGREADDPLGDVQAEAQLKAGEQTYVAFDGSPYRWGDYTGMTVDPDGSTFWYLGEYAKSGNTGAADWGTYIGSFSYGCEPQVGLCSDDFEDSEANLCGDPAVP